MIDFFYEFEENTVDFKLEDQNKVSQWIAGLISSEGYEEGDITYVFCSDSYLHRMNVEYLKHDTLTDIISFDYSLGKQIHGEIYISIERVKENAEKFKVTFLNEIHRVMIHGILHYCGYKDKTEADSKQMRNKEDEALSNRHFL